MEEKYQVLSTKITQLDKQLEAIKNIFEGGSNAKIFGNLTLYADDFNTSLPNITIADSEGSTRAKYVQ